MRGIATLILFLTTACVWAQSERCDFVDNKYQKEFERWLSSRRATARTQEPAVYKIPVVVHVIHPGDALGEGYNFPKDRITGQIKTLNEDFRRMTGTPGFNDDPDGGDVRVEFVLAQKDPDGNPTDGIVRVDMTSVEPGPDAGDIITLCSRYSYWDPDRYLNVWCLYTGLPPGLLLGSGRFPITDIEGGESWDPQPHGEGVFINALNFGSTDTLNDPNYNMGRTLTHELGHFFGLLHTWGSINNSRQCDAYTDYCDDTPPTAVATNGCPSIKPTACDGGSVMVGNYMDGSYDACMNIFTHDQITRMRTVLENSPHRKSLTTSPVIDRGVVTGVDDPTPIILYPNPAADKAYLTMTKVGGEIQITAYNLSGQMLFRRRDIVTSTEHEIPLDDVREKVIILVADVNGKSYSYLTYLSGR